MKLSATANEAVANADIEISQEEDSEARPGAPGPRTSQDGGAEQPDICQRSADLRARHSRIRGLALFGAAPCVQPDCRAPVTTPSISLVPTSTRGARQQVSAGPK